MGIDRQKTADQILKAIEFGNLPRDEIERRLNWIIDSELSGSITSQVDSNMIDLCNSLLLQLQTHGKVSFVDNAEKSKRAVAEKYESWKQKSSSVKTRVRYAAAFVVLMIIMSLPAILPSIRWQNRISNPDEQQYIIEGHEITTQAVARAIESHNGEGSLITGSKEEAEEFLGFELTLPDTLIGKYKASKYYVQISPEMISCVGSYFGATESSILQIGLIIFDNVNNSYIQFEQQKKGKYTQIDDAFVYQLENTNNFNYVWLWKNGIYNMSSFLSENENMNIIKELLKGRIL